MSNKIRINAMKTLSYSISIMLMGITLSYAAVIPPGTQLAEKQEIVRNNGAEPASLDVDKVEGNVAINIINDFFDTLVSVDNKGNIVPKLAESWETKDNKTWIFHLRKGIKWSDGTPITADDVVFSWRRLTDPKTLSPYGSYFVDASVVNAKEILAGKKKVEELGVKALDDMTLVITLEKPVGYFLHMLAFAITSPIDEKIVKKYGDKWTNPKYFVSSGAFKLSEWKVNEKIVGIRNPYYWDNKNTVINKVTYLPLTSSISDLNRYLAGEIDMTFTIPLEHSSSLKKQIGSQIHITPILSTYYFNFNNKKPPFNDVRVRLALGLALDRDIIANKVVAQGQIPAYAILPPGIGGFNFKKPDYESWTQEQRNQKAKQLLSEAGFNKTHPLTFNLVYNSSDLHKKIAIAATSMWKKNLGVIVNMQTEEWKVLLDNEHQGKFDVVRGGWVSDYNNPMSFLVIFTTNQTNNTSFYSNKDYDSLVRKAGETNNQEDFQKAADLLTKDMPIIPVYYYVNAILVKPYIGGYSSNSLGQTLTKDLYVIKH
ncbi:oligopeptide ABC transporter substrate-binding protein OppA [Xenorhabdus sp. 42]|uniref:ABC transporter substrate-binding protein n=1 Tax=Xenorhabdus szentirmaii TaxID=290112 RepID=UPI0019B64B7D|nr:MULTISPECIES: ABC transporter substrate-binding protein [unclassified Xenorhabdus]MBD2779553.1 oligopeptide ABC transporter substrate-binding protein OppA [Xenorhabdus sp. 38]MBD2803957.1 oligopeptide ABC transporter substrate-binding protein OppA [Xenorhabdus sp. ZM]MBD2820255.1 oligopeptide ABC transporter substrate-binding protein OppA [Xenorhabdus sp. 42]MBD2825141.1 oligopeptide ABC transporter substrate-binding protein OppA [Xenorhabdus sp. 5]